MPFGGGEIHQATFREQIDAASVFQNELLDKFAHFAFFDREFFQLREY